MDVHTPYWDSSVVAQAACGGAHVHVQYMYMCIQVGPDVHVYTLW